jgi:Major Facilitator Superfamily
MNPRKILQDRGLRLIFAANVISMVGSGLNAAAVTWYVLQATRSETALGFMLMLQTIPAMLLLPFSGVVIDREDRRRLVMFLDASRGMVVLAVAALALSGTVHLWQVYAMSALVAAGFWMFWPTMNALIQELTPESEFAQANSFILAGFQGGWLVAGAIVGFVYNHIGLGGVLLIDFFTYVLSFTCYLFVRRGRHVVAQQSTEQHESEVARFFHELGEGVAYIRLRPRLLLLGSCWALFMGGMLSQGIITAPLSDRLLKAGAVGYGWLNSGWAVGACLTALYTPRLLRGTGHRGAIGVAMALLASCLIALPFIGARVHGGFELMGMLVGINLMAAVSIYFVMGCCRAFGGVAITTGMMEMVPKRFMGRVQNAFYFAATALQLGLSFAVGTAAHRLGLAYGFAIVGGVYFLACISGTWPAKDRVGREIGQPAVSTGS